MRTTLSTSQVARLLGVAAGSVAKWIDHGQLKAGRTPGGHRRVVAGDLIAFLRQQNLPIPAELERGTLKVLVVDDEQAVTRRLATEIGAEHPDYEVLAAHDGFSAGELVGSAKPDVVILNLQMAGMDACEVCRWIRSRDGSKDIVVIAMTATPSPEVEKRILECGASVCLAKPLDSRVLMRELEQAARRRR